MKVKYNIRSLIIEDNEIDFIEIKLESSSLNWREIQILKKSKIEYKVLKNKEILLIVKSFYSYFVEIDGESKGIFFEKTKRYNRYLKNALLLRTEEEKNKIKNLIISKEGVRVEIEVKI